VPRVHTVKKAAKDYPESDIKKGQEYFWWKFRRGPLVRSKTYPKPSQLTRSEFYGTLLEIQDRISNLSAESVDDLESQVSEIAGEVRELGESCREKFDNMPDGLQQGDTGQLLESRAEAMESAADELDGIDFDIDPPDEEELKDELGDDLEDEDEEGITEEERQRRKDDNESLKVDKKDEMIRERIQDKIEEVQNVSLEAE
jgi:PAS domain-containing protein